MWEPWAWRWQGWVEGPGLHGSAYGFQWWSFPEGSDLPIYWEMAEVPVAAGLMAASPKTGLPSRGSEVACAQSGREGAGSSAGDAPHMM